MDLAETFALKMTPEPFRVFLPYVSPSGLSVVHKEEVLKLVSRIARDRFSSDTRAQARAALAATVEKSSFVNRIEISPALGIPLEVSKLSALERCEVGERILALYFLMLKGPGAIFLDLRLEHFEWDASRSILRYSPPALFYAPSRVFSERVAGLYDGFYRGDAARASAGAALYAWECKPSDGYLERVEKLLRHHFGAANTEKISFSITHFKSSFHEIFEEAKRSHSKFHPELTTLGLVLVTLYLALESLGEAYDVRSVYLEVNP